MIQVRGNSLRVMVYAGKDTLTGKKRWKTETVTGISKAARKEAERVEARLKLEVQSGQKPTSPTKFGNLLDEWLVWRESNRPLGAATRATYVSDIEKRLKPALGHYALADIDAFVLDRFYGELRKRGGPNGRSLSESRVRQVHAIVSGALSLAVRWRRLPYNPAAGAVPPAAPKRQRAHPTPEQVRTLLAEAGKKGPEFELQVRLSAIAGMRRGETLALRWCDIDLSEGLVRVTGSALFLAGLEGGYTRKAPKSERSRRAIALDARTVELLRQLREKTCPSSAEAYLFPGRSGDCRPVRGDATSRRFTRLAAKLGHSYTLHGLRHFMASQAGAVAEAATVRDRLGHADLAITGLYTHRVDEADRRVASHMATLVDA